MGQVPAMMHKTLLSLGRTDKADKPYLIGVFGQGGSSAFSIAKYSVVVTRRAADIRGTVIRAPAGRSSARFKPRAGAILILHILLLRRLAPSPSVDAAEADKAGFFLGAHFCHIGYDFGASDSAIARSMYQSLNHVLFNPVMPYELFALKDTPEPMLGTAQWLARRVRLYGRGVALDKSFAAQHVA
jgi:hypothetical protein